MESLKSLIGEVLSLVGGIYITAELFLCGSDKACWKDHFLLSVGYIALSLDDKKNNPDHVEKRDGSLGTNKVANKNSENNNNHNKDFTLSESQKNFEKNARILSALWVKTLATSNNNYVKQKQLLELQGKMNLIGEEFSKNQKYVNNWYCVVFNVISSSSLVCRSGGVKYELNLSNTSDSLMTSLKEGDWISYSGLMHKDTFYSKKRYDLECGGEIRPHVKDATIRTLGKNESQFVTIFNKLSAGKEFDDLCKNINELNNVISDFQDNFEYFDKELTSSFESHVSTMKDADDSVEEESSSIQVENPSDIRASDVNNQGFDQTVTDESEQGELPSSQENTIEQLLFPDEPIPGTSYASLEADWKTNIMARFRLGECPLKEFRDQGYKYLFFTDVPIKQAKRKDKVWNYKNDRAIIGLGCWYHKEGTMTHVKLKRIFKEDWEKDVETAGYNWVYVVREKPLPQD